MCGVNGTQGAAPGQMSPAALNAVQGAGAASRFWTGDPNRRIGIATNQYSLTRPTPTPSPVPGGQQVVTADPLIRIGSAPAALPPIVSPAAAAAPSPEVPLPRPRPEAPSSNDESWSPPPDVNLGGQPVPAGVAPLPYGLGSEADQAALAARIAAMPQSQLNARQDGIVDPRAVALAANPNAYSPGSPAPRAPAVAGRAAPAPVSVPLPVPRPQPPVASAPGLGQRVQLPDGRMGVVAAPGLAIADGDNSGRYVGLGGGVRNPLAALFGG